MVADGIQKLKDRFIEYIQAGKVFSVLHYHKQMGEQGLLEVRGEYGAPGICDSHSTQHISAVAACAELDDSPINRLHLQMLLHYVPDEGRASAYHHAGKAGQSWSIELMKRWDFGGKEEATLARKVLSVEPEEGEHLVLLELSARLEAATKSKKAPESYLTPALTSSRATSVDGRTQAQLPAPKGSSSSTDPIAPPPAPAPKQQRLRPHNYARLDSADHAQLGPKRAPRPPSPRFAQFASAPNTHAYDAVEPAQPGLRLHLGYLPYKISQKDVENLLHEAVVPFSSLRLTDRDRSNYTSAHFNVPTRAAYLHASEKLHDLSVRGWRLRLEPNSARPSSRHPFILLGPLPLQDEESSVDLIHDLSRASRCGAYDRKTILAPNGQYHLGMFRVPGPEWANDAYRHLSTVSVARTKLLVQWFWPDELDKAIHSSRFNTLLVASGAGAGSRAGGGLQLRPRDNGYGSRRRDGTRSNGGGADEGDLPYGDGNRGGASGPSKSSPAQRPPSPTFADVLPSSSSHASIDAANKQNPPPQNPHDVEDVKPRIPPEVLDLTVDTPPPPVKQEDELASNGQQGTAGPASGEAQQSERGAVSGADLFGTRAVRRHNELDEGAEDRKGKKRARYDRP